MSNLSSSQPVGRVQARALPRFNRSLWLTLLFALGLIAALLFIFSARASATPSETLIQQRIENSALTSSTASVTGTYGERITVTLRFTITANTVLTGPVQLTTRFAGVIVTPSTQTGVRFLDQQGPTPMTGSTPPLAPTNFATQTLTSGSVPNLNSTTYLTWTFDGITTTVDPYVYEVAYQVRLVYDGLDTGGNVTFGSNETRITWNAPGTNYKIAMNGVSLNRVFPELAYSTKTYRGIPTMQGGATVMYTLTLRNGNNPTGFSPAYELIVTDTLDARLTYNTAFPTPDSHAVVPGQGTVMTWTPGSLLPSATWVAYITATLPPTMAANQPFFNTAIPTYSSLPGANPDEADYTRVISVAAVGGIIGTKQASPLSNVRIGDAVTYTIRITVNPNIYMNAPIFTDTLPVGFRYRAGTFSYSGATLNGSVVTGTAGTQEQLIWKFMNIPLNAGVQLINVSYIADVTGLNVNGSVVYAPPGTGQSNADNAVAGTWQTTDGTVAGLITPLVGRTTIAQPYFNSLSKTIKTWPLGNPEEIGSQVNYEIALTNTGTITGYEVVLNDILPPGMVFKQTVSVLPANLVLLAQPAEGTVGTVQWIFQEIPKTTVKLEFSAIVSNTGRPGDTLSNTVSVADYTSQPGTTHPYDRHYGFISGALPTPARVGFVLKGLTAIKTDVPDPVLPGQVMTYFIAYSNTSAVYTATNVQIIDTYDPLLTFISANPPGSHNVGARTLTWGPSTLSANSGNNYITATFTVATGVSRTIRTITNTITSDSAAPAPAMSRIVTTTLVQPKPTINLDDKGISVRANGYLTYTMVYSNASAATGATTGTFTVTLGYAPYISYTGFAATPTNPPGPYHIAGSNGTVFTDTLAPGAVRTVQLYLRVARPLPYNLTSFTSTATIYQPLVDVSDSESEETPVVLPVYQLVKTRTTPGNPPVNANDSLVYVIDITNTGSVTGTNVVVTDVWDLNTYNHLGTGNWTLHGTYGVYTTIASLAPGASVQLDPLSMIVAPSLPPNAQLIRNVAQLTSRETTQQQTIFDTPIVGLYMQKSHTPDPVYPGEVFTYTIDYVAYSPGIVAPILTDTLPTEVTYLSCAGAESCAYQSGKVVWSWPGGLTQGASGVVTAVVRAPNTEWITLTNTYASNSSGGASYREGSPDLTYIGRPHLSITKQASTAVTPAAPGDLIVYTLTYANAGSYKATNAVAHDTVPVNTTFFSCSGAPCSETNGIVDWSLGEIPITTTRAVTLVVRVNPSAGTTTIINNVYSLSADREVFNENTPPTVNTSVVRPALTVVKSVAPSWIALGQTVTYTVRYTNTGGGTFTTLLFTDTVDNRLTVESTSGNCATDVYVVTCTDASLAPGQSRQFTITVRAVSVSNSEVVTNFARYLAANQAEVLPEGQSNTIEVPASNVGAAADFVGTPVTGGIGLNVTFTNLSGGSGITGCTWEFGDGQTNTTACQPGSTINHPYNQPGVYTVKLTINTPMGSGSNTRTRTNYINISGAAAYGVQIASPQPAKSGNRGTQVIYTVVVTNTGTVPDTFTLSLPGSGYDWVTNLNTTSTGTLAPQSSAIATATVNIPASGPMVDSDVVTITATSNGSPLTTSSVVLKTSTPAYAVFLPLIKK